MHGLRSYFASVCLIAVAECAEHLARGDFNLEEALLNREAHHSNDLYVHPDKIPNWMRGFYDDFPPEPRRERRRWERSHERREDLDHSFLDLDIAA